MSDEESDELPELVLTDGEIAMASYESHTAQLCQAFGNLVTQLGKLPADHWLASVGLHMLEKVAANVETAPKGSLRAVKGGKD